MSSPGCAGLELPLWLPGLSTCCCRRWDAVRSWREIPSAGSPRDLTTRRRRLKGQEPATCRPVRGVTAALAGGGFKGRSYRASAAGSAPSVLFECQARGTRIAWKWRISNFCLRMAILEEEKQMRV
jgi:hypothetical protein